MARHTFKHIFFILLLLLLNIVSFGQGAFKNEADLKKEAERLFEEEQYAEALPLFSQLLSLYQKDPNYNFKYGACALYATEDKEGPLKYIEFASRNPETEKEVFFHLGRAYQLNYRFFEAEKAYKTFKEKSSGKVNTRLNVDRAIETCNNGKFLMNKITDLTVIEKKSLKDKEFFRAYELEGLTGKLVIKPEEFQTSVDKKKKEQTVIYVSPSDKAIFFASYGENEKNSRDIYKVVKLPNGEFSKPVNLGTTINTSYDEDFPFMHPDGKTLYFCSKGHNSMGGYDIFKSIYDETTNTWSKPVNMDFAINSPDDDIMFVTDKDNKVACFASKRSSIMGDIHVYKIRLEAAPQLIAVIKGKILAPDNGKPITQITVKNINENGQVEGVFKSNTKGKYTLNLPAGGKFQFIVEAEGYEKQTEFVEVPALNEFRVLTQQIEFKNEGGVVKMVLTNEFDPTAQPSEEILAEALKERASLDINYNAEIEKVNEEFAAANTTAVENKNADVKAAEKANETAKANNESPAANTSKPTENSGDFVKMAFEDAGKSKADAEELKINSDKAFELAAQKNELAKKQAAEADQVLANANNISDKEAKQAELNKAETLKQESAKNYKQALVSYNLGQNLEKDYSNKKKEAEIDMLYAKELEATTQGKSKNQEELDRLSDEKEKLEDENKISIGTTAELTQASEIATEKQEEFDKKNAKLNELNKEITDIETEKSNIAGEIKRTKDKQLKETFNKQIADLDAEKASKQEQANKLNEEVASLKDEVTIAQQNVVLMNEVVNNFSTMQTPAAPVDKSKVASEITNSPLSASANQPLSETALNNTSTTSGNSAANANPSVTESTTTNSTVSNESAALPVPAEYKIAAGMSSEMKAKPYIIQAENDFAAAEKISEPLTKAQAQQKIYSELDAIITDDLNTNKEKLLVTKDKNEKKNLEASIKDLEQAQKQNAGKLDASSKEVATLTTTQATLANNTGNEVSNTGNNTTTTNTAENTNTSVAPAENKTIASTDKANLQSNSMAVNYDAEIQKVEAITDPAEKEKKRLELNQQYIAAINKDIEADRAKLNNVRSESEKVQVEENIVKLEKTKKQKMDEIDNAISVMANTSTTPNPANNTSAATIDTSSAAKTIAANGSNNNAPAVNPLVESNQKFQQATFEFNQNQNDINAMPSETAREKARIEADKDYIEAIDERTKVVKQVLVASSNSAEINDLNREVENLANLKKEKESEIEKSTKRLDEIATLAANNTSNNTNNNAVTPANTVNENAANNNAANNENATPTNENAANNNTGNTANNATNNSPVNENTAANTTIANNNTNTANTAENENANKPVSASVQLAESKQKFQQATFDFNRKQNEMGSLAELEKENAKVEANKTYIAAIDEHNQDIKRVLVKTSSADEITELNKDVAYLDNLKKEKETELEKSNKRITELSALAATTNPAVNASNPETNAANNLNNVTNTATNTNNETAVSTTETSNTVTPATNEAAKPATQALLPPGTETRIAYANPAAEPELKKAEVQNAELSKLNEEAAAQVTAAKNADMASKMQLVLKADSARNKAQLKEIELNETFAVVNTAEYKGNEQKLFEYNAKYSNSDNDDAIVAALLNEEANSLFTQAKQTRETGARANDNTTKINAQQRAYELEAQAIEKQQKAMTAYAKVPASMASRQALAVNTPANNNPANTNNNATSAANTNENVNTANNNTITNNNASENNPAANNNVVNNEASNTNTQTNSINNENAVNAVNTESAKQPDTNNTSETANNTNSGNENGNTATANNTESPVNANANVSPVNSLNTSANVNAPATSTPKIIAPANLKNVDEFFEKVNVNVPVYTNDNPIPINPELPSGLIFKVQIGAFRKPIPQDVFKGFNPVTGETTKSGLTRYSAGIFRSYKTANSAKDDIRSIGYRDAFVVAYYDGKRISFNEAMAMVNGQAGANTALVNDNGARTELNDYVNNAAANNNVPANNTLAANNNRGNIANNTTNVNDANNTNVAGNNAGTNETNTAANTAINTSTNTAAGTNFSALTGMAYTVQVGVYSKQVSADKLFNVQPLYVENMANGNLRYTCGIYDNMADAVKAKNAIKGLGINDAFVTAVRNGRRIPMNEAKQIEAEQGKAAFIQSPEINKQPARSNGAVNNSENVPVTPVNKPVNTTQENPQPVNPQPGNIPANIVQQESNTATNQPATNVITNNAAENNSTQEVTPSNTTVNVNDINATPLTPVESGSGVAYNDALPDSGVVYKVQIGAFRDEVPNDIAAMYLRIASKGINHYTDENDLTIYTVGRVGDLETAEKLKAEVQAEGLKDAFVVAYKNKKKVDVETARQLNGGK